MPDAVFLCRRRVFLQNGTVGQEVDIVFIVAQPVVTDGLGNGDAADGPGQDDLITVFVSLPCNQPAKGIVCHMTGFVSDSAGIFRCDETSPESKPAFIVGRDEFGSVTGTANITRMLSGQQAVFSCHHTRSPFFHLAGVIRCPGGLQTLAFPGFRLIFSGNFNLPGNHQVALIAPVDPILSFFGGQYLENGNIFSFAGHRSQMTGLVQSQDLFFKQIMNECSLADIGINRLRHRMGIGRLNPVFQCFFIEIVKTLFTAEFGIVACAIFDLVDQWMSDPSAGSPGRFFCGRKDD